MKAKYVVVSTILCVLSLAIHAEDVRAQIRDTGDIDYGPGDNGLADSNTRTSRDCKVSGRLYFAGKWMGPDNDVIHACAARENRLDRGDPNIVAESCVYPQDGGEPWTVTCHCNCYFEKKGCNGNSFDAFEAKAGCGVYERDGRSYCGSTISEHNDLIGGISVGLWAAIGSLDYGEAGAISAGKGPNGWEICQAACYSLANFGDPTKGISPKCRG